MEWDIDVILIKTYLLIRCQSKHLDQKIIQGQTNGDIEWECDPEGHRDV
jgi:hypothetical protein